MTILRLDESLYLLVLRYSQCSVLTDGYFNRHLEEDLYMRHWVLVPALIAPVMPVAAWYWAQARQPPEYDWVRQTISALAARNVHDRWIMTVGLFALGLCHLVTAMGLQEARICGRVALGLGGVATIAVAAMPQPAPGHLIAAGIALSLLAVWPALSRVPAPRTRLTATLVLLILLAWFASQLHSGSALGLSERILVAAEAVWPLLTAIAVSFHAANSTGSLSYSRA